MPQVNATSKYDLPVTLTRKRTNVLCKSRYSPVRKLLRELLILFQVKPINEGNRFTRTNQVQFAEDPPIVKHFTNPGIIILKEGGFMSNRGLTNLPLLGDCLPQALEGHLLAFTRMQIQARQQRVPDEAVKMAGSLLLLGLQLVDVCCFFYAFKERALYLFHGISSFWWFLEKKLSEEHKFNTYYSTLVVSESKLREGHHMRKIADIAVDIRYSKDRAASGSVEQLAAAFEFLHHNSERRQREHRS